MSEKMIRVITPLVTADDLKGVKGNEDMFMQASLPKGFTSLGVIAIPSLVDMMGFSGGGGPPGFVYLIDPNEEVLEEVLLSVVPPEITVIRDNKNLLTISCRGLMQCQGALLAGIEYRGEGMHCFIEELKEKGALITASQNYTVPKELANFAKDRLQRAKTNV